MTAAYILIGAVILEVAIFAPFVLAPLVIDRVEAWVEARRL